MYLYRRFGDAQRLNHTVQWLTRLGFEARKQQPEPEQPPQLVASAGILMMAPLKQLLSALEHIEEGRQWTAPAFEVLPKSAPESVPVTTPIHWQGREADGPDPYSRFIAEWLEP